MSTPEPFATTQEQGAASIVINNSPSSTSVPKMPLSTKQMAPILSQYVEEYKPDHLKVFLLRPLGLDDIRARCITPAAAVIRNRESITGRADGTTRGPFDRDQLSLEVLTCAWRHLLADFDKFAHVEFDLSLPSDNQVSLCWDSVGPSHASSLIVKGEEVFSMIVRSAKYMLLRAEHRDVNRDVDLCTENEQFLPQELLEKLKGGLAEAQSTDEKADRAINIEQQKILRKREPLACGKSVLPSLISLACGRRFRIYHEVPEDITQQILALSKSDPFMLGEMPEAILPFEIED